MEMCTGLSAGLLRSVKEFHEAVFGAAFVCCQKQDDRALVFEPQAEGQFTLGPVFFQIDNCRKSDNPIDRYFFHDLIEVGPRAKGFQLDGSKRPSC